MVVYSGPRMQCRDFSLVLEAQAIEHEVVASSSEWRILVAPADLARAYEEISRFAAEPAMRRPPSRYLQPFAGALYGSVGYGAVLLLVAYAAGAGLFHLDWLLRGALDSSPDAHLQWWRAITALTLHVDREHLLSNLLFGILAGVAASRLVGPGVAWGGATVAAGAANLLEMLISPATHRAIGASTAVFAMLGLVSGLASIESASPRERLWRRWAPVIIGACLLTLFGGGGQDPNQPLPPATHVDVLGHLLGFVSGTAAGWLMAKARVDETRSARRQLAVGAATLFGIAAAWLLALLFG